MICTRIEAMARVAVALALLMADDAHAQQREFYDTRTGRSVGRSTTDSQGSTTIYGADGKIMGRTSTSRDGTVTVYGADGRKAGTVTTQQKREEP